ncbi:MAG: response regulator [bacterium]
MGSVKDRFQFHSIKARLTFWFLLVALLPLITVTKVIYDQRVESVKTNEANKLTIIRDLKVERIGFWMSDNSIHIRAMANHEELRALGFLFHSDGSRSKNGDTIDHIREHLVGFKDNFKDFLELSLINASTGRVEISTDKTREGENSSERPYFTEPLKTGKTYISSIYYSERLSGPTMFFSTPIYCLQHSGEHISGILAGRIDLEKSIFPLLLTWEGMGTKGETVIVNKEAMVLNTLKWQGDAPLKLTVKDRASLLASQGNTGLTEATDYRGEKVLAAYTFFPANQWGIIVKQDLKEIYAPLRDMLRHILMLLLMSMIGVWVIVTIVTRNISQPVFGMTEVSKKLQGGELSARNRMTRPDEFGYLARTFDSLADSIVSQMNGKRGSADITDTMLAATHLRDFAERLLKKLIEITGSHLGAFYLRGHGKNTFELFTSLGLSAEAQTSFDAEKSEGEFGLALVTKNITHIENISKDTVFTFKTFLGTALPKEIMTIPLVVQDSVPAMISLATLNKFSPESREMLKQTRFIINTALANQLANTQTLELARELSSKNKQLQIQTEELQMQKEELEQQSEELQQQNVELEIQRQHIEEANRLKDEFLSNMSHELRTPLNSIMALSHVLIMRSAPKLSSEEKQYLEVIERNGKNLLLLINDILDLAKIGAGQVKINLRSVSLASTLETIVERLAPIAREKGIELKQDVPDNLPFIESDEERVHQIFQNIVGNAVKFTQQGRVTISAIHDEHKVSVRVADTGIGIAEGDVEHIFKEFRQVNGTASRKFEGTGLGLSIASKAASLLGGEISVESALGEGSAFTVTLPITWPGTAPALPPVTIYPAQEIQEKQKPILIIEDEPEVAAAIFDYLSQKGYRPLMAACGKEGLLLARRHCPLAIILDVIMPEMDGWEVLQNLKKNSRTAEIPVIIFSISDDRETGLALGAAGYISKPKKKGELLVNDDMAPLLEKIELVSGGMSRHSPAHPEHGAGNRILLVEDNESAIIQVKTVLEQEGYLVDVARGGEEALTYVKQRIPDGIILDLMMPGINGFEVLEKIRSSQETSAIPVLILTAKDLTSDELKRLTSNHVQQLVQKGDVDKEGLLSKVNMMLKMEGETSSHELPGAERKEDQSPDTEDRYPEHRDRGNKDPTILVIEDNPDNIMAVKSVLKDTYKVLTATDGEEGLKMAFSQMPDLVLLDMSLPVIDGLAVVREIKKDRRTRSIPVIALTARAMKGERETIIKAGCDDYLAKPIHPQQLLSSIKKLL